MKTIINLGIILTAALLIGTLILIFFLPWKTDLYFIEPIRFTKFNELSQQYSLNPVYVGSVFKDGTEETFDFLFIDTNLNEGQFESMVKEKRKGFLIDMANSAKFGGNVGSRQISSVFIEQGVFDTSTKQADPVLIYQAQVMISRYKLWKLTKENSELIKYTFTHDFY